MRALLCMLAVLIMASTNYALVYTAHLYAPAVESGTVNGTLTLVEVNVSPGTGHVSVIGPQSVGSSTLQSAQTAAAYAFSYLLIDQSHYNVTYFINTTSSSVSGPSAGLALTLLAISALSNKHLNSDFTVTGTISPNGSVGVIGGEYDKSQAASQAGLSYILVPAVQNGSLEQLIYYISQQNNGIPVVEVGNVSDALPYAFGSPSIENLSFNYSEDYYLAGMPRNNITCTGCNQSLPYFYNMTNFTDSFVQQEITGISPAYPSAAASLQQQLGNYEQIGDNGYLYTSADLAFIESGLAFTLLNAQNPNMTNALALVGSTRDLCNSLTPPPLTAQNYEYVIGGELRQSWGLINANDTLQLLKAANASDMETTDDIIEGIYSIGPSYAWCASAGKMYDIASSIGGTPVSLGSNIKSSVLSALGRIPEASSDRYAQSAWENYDEGNYGAALYAVQYYDSLSSSLLPANSSLVQETTANIRNSTFGVWPSQFAGEAQFYLYEAGKVQGAQRNGTLQNAYTTSLLAASLASANKEITGDFVYGVVAPISNSSESLQIAQLNQSIQNIYVLLLIILAVLIVMILIQLAHLVSNRNHGAPARQARGRVRQRRAAR